MFTATPANIYANRLSSFKNQLSFYFTQAGKILLEGTNLKFDVFTGVRFRLWSERIVHCDLVFLSSHFTEVWKERSGAYLSLQLFHLQFSPMFSTVCELKMWHLKYPLPFYTFCNAVVIIIIIIIIIFISFI